MPRSVKHGGKKQHRYRYAPNANNARKKAIKKNRDRNTNWMTTTIFSGSRLLPLSPPPQIAAEWNRNKTLKQNLDSMGLALDPNKSIKSTHQKIVIDEPMDIDDGNQSTAASGQKTKKKKPQKVVDEPMIVDSVQQPSASSSKPTASTATKKVGRKDETDAGDKKKTDKVVPEKQKIVNDKKPTATVTPPTSVQSASPPPKQPVIVQKAPSIEKPAPVQKAPSVEKPAIVQKAPSVEKPAIVQKAPSVEKPAPVQKAPSIEKPAIVQKAASIEKQQQVPKTPESSMSETRAKPADLVQPMVHHQVETVSKSKTPAEKIHVDISHKTISNNNNNNNNIKDLSPTPTAVSAEPSKVVEALEKAAKEEEARVKRERMYRLLPKDILFCTRMIEAHNDDFEAMSRDSQNIYQETSKQIGRKIRIFKESPHYETYLNAKSEGRMLFNE